MELTATIDRKVKVVTEASVKRHLKLKDSDGISILPTTEIFDQLALMGSSTHTHVADEAASTNLDVRHGRFATTVTSLDAGQGSELTVLCTTLSQKVESLKVDLKQTKKVYGAAYTKLIMKVKKLEKTVKTSQARRKAKIVVFDEEVALEDTSKQWRRKAHSQEDQPDDQLGVLSLAKVLADIARRNVQTYTRRRAVSTGNGRVSTASRIISTIEELVSTARASMPVSTVGMIDKGKGIMEESESDVIKTKRQQEQERLGYEAAVRLQEQFDKEERQRMGSYSIKRLKKLSFDEIKEVFEATMRSIKDFVPMESEDDKAVPKLAEARSSKRDAEEELNQGRSKKQKIGESLEPRNKDVDKLSQEELQQLMIIKIIRVRNHTEVYQFFDDMLKVFNRDDLVQPWSLAKERFSSTKPTDDKERVLWVELKRLIEPDNNDEL
nr:hypothetical protein [Tanacetum cinerariifolium]